MLPEGWCSFQLRDVLKLASGDGRPSDVGANQSTTHRYPVYGGNGVLGYSRTFNSESEDIIIGRVGEYCGVTRFVTGPKWITDNALYTVEINERFDIAYLGHLIRSYDLSRVRSKGGQPLVTQKPIYGLRFDFPPQGEQVRIVNILSTWDAAISAQERLIANAKRQKRALMQTLLPTGSHPPKKRLPGFSGDWESTTLENVAQVIVSNVDKKSGEGEQAVRLCNYMDVYRADWIEADMPFMRATAAAAQIQKFGLRVGDVLITKDSETPDDIAVPSYVASTAPDLVCGYHLAIIRAKPEADGQFLKYYFEQPTTQHFFASRANGATRFGLTIGAIESAPIALPSPPEQRRIGEAIAIAELEIHRLLPIAEALRQEKSALMQQLLTGKRRVRVEGSDHEV